MKKFICVMLLLAISSNSFAFEAEPFDTKDKLLLGTTVALLAVDWLQTRYIVESEHFYEKNPILGKNPSKNEVNIYFAAVTAGIVAVSYMLPSDYRKSVLTGVILLQSVTVIKNNSIGIKLEF